jgi:hypothetical protein
MFSVLQGLLLLAACMSGVLGGTAFAVSSCPSNTYFDASSLTCASCASTGVPNVSPSNTSRDILGYAESCACGAGYASIVQACDLTAPLLSNSPLASSLLCPFPATCSACPTGTVPSRLNASQCATCDESTVGVLDGDCACQTLPLPALPARQLLTSELFMYELYGFKQCMTCAPGSLAFYTGGVGITADRYSCVSCSHPVATITSSGTCTCAAGYVASGVTLDLPSGTSADTILPFSTPLGVNCVKTSAVAALAGSYPESAAVSVSFRSVQLTVNGEASNSVTGLLSKSYQHLYLTAATGCLTYAVGTSAQSCHALANLCVLQLMSPTSTVCMLYNALINGRRGAVHGLPKLANGHANADIRH